MFDTILIHENHLKTFFNADQGNESDLKYLVSSDGYCEFQTKDLENALCTFKLKEDNKLYLHKYLWVKIDPADKEPEDKTTNITSYVEFYTYFNTDKDKIYLSLNMHLVDGNLHEMNLSALERESLESVELRAKKARLFWETRETFWEMKMFRFIQNLEWKISKIWRNLAGNRYYLFKKWLSDRAEEKAKQSENDTSRN